MAPFLSRPALELRSLLALLAFGAVLAPGSAHAIDVSPAELARLARRARSEAGAFARLERVTSVEGVPVNLAQALRGASGKRLNRRLSTLASGGVARFGSTTSRDRRRAREVLSQRRFHTQEVPRPFAGLLRRIGRLLQPVGNAFSAAFGWLARRLPGGDSSVWALLAALVLAAGAAISVRLGHRRARTTARLDPAPSTPRRDARALERAAEEAAAAGDYEGAVRLRFVAGLLRLDQIQAIRFRPSLTTSEITGALSSTELEALARSFDEIAYGGRRALPADLEQARAGWRRLLHEVAS